LAIFNRVHFVQDVVKKLVDERLVNLTVDAGPPELAKDERERLYCEILYTIKHKIGCTMSGHNDFNLDLYKYAQSAFGVSLTDHERLYALISEEKVINI
jgi:hypothetical protein